jgi:hypothetical protein
LIQPQATIPIPGIYPLIIHLNPPQKGKDNIGIGFTQHNEQFLLKDGGRLGAAEFVGARVCDACGIPACQPSIVTIEQFGVQRNVFGSRIESGAASFDQLNIVQWQQVMAMCSNPDVFSALLAVDLALGNDDRHWNNWLIQNTQTQSGANSFRFRAMDFSRSWPVTHPAQHPLAHNSPNTWTAAKEWSLMGVAFNQTVFFDTCAKIGSLSVGWLRGHAMQQLSGVLISPAEVEHYCQWWEHHFKAQVIEAIYSLENGVWP